MSPHRSALPMATRFRHPPRDGKIKKRTFMAIKRYVTGPGTTGELVVLLVVAATIWLANLHFHWFQ